jgi:hypothetical protein
VAASQGQQPVVEFDLILDIDAGLQLLRILSAVEVGNHAQRAVVVSIEDIDG